MRDERLGLRVTPEMKKALRKAADQQQRSVSRLVEMIVHGWLLTNGHLGMAARPPVGGRGRRGTRR